MSSTARDGAGSATTGWSEGAVAGRRLGRYELLHELGRGGMATVYLARVRGPGGFVKWVAVKTIRGHLSEDRSFVDMFLDEGRIAAALQHPNVCQVFDLGEERGEHFIAMEYLHGEHLGAVTEEANARRGGIPPELVAHMIARVARGLHHAHEARDARGRPLELVHRDVSPKNIFVGYDGWTKITDFGVAKAANRLTSTVAGGVKGKWSYMSPEQVQAEPLDRRSDVFSLGIVLWETATGQRLFQADSEMRVVMRITSGQVPRPSSVRAGLPAELEAIAMKALARRPADRYQTAADLAVALESFIGSTAGAEPAVAVARLMRDLFEHRILARDAMLERFADLSLARPEEAGPGSAAEAARRIAAEAALEGVAGDAGAGAARASAAAAGDAGSGATEIALAGVTRDADGGAAGTALATAAAPGRVAAPVRPGPAPEVPLPAETASGVRTRRTPPRRRTALWVSTALAGLVAAGVGAALVWSLVAADRTSVVHVASLPSGAAVTIDGRGVDGTTPLVVEAVPRGRHAVELRLAGHAPLSATFDAAGERVDLMYGLVPAPPPTAPEPEPTPATAPAPDAGAPRPQTDAATPAARDGGPRPPRESPPEGEGRRPSPAAEPRGAPGYVNIIAEPWATVTIDGAAAGQTPIVRREVPSGTVTVRLQREGTGEVRTLRLEVPPGATVSRRVVFE